MNDDLLAAYVAGLFEGEGWVGTHPNGPPRMAVNMSDLEPLVRIQTLLGGHITGPYIRNPAHKPLWSWRQQGFGPVEVARRLLGPWLSPRRLAQFDTAFANSTPVERRGMGTYNRIKTHCKRGHEFTVANTRHANGRRHCRACVTARRLEKGAR